jgi:hypothetical protein
VVTDDADKLKGQALADAVAVEVMGWTLDAWGLYVGEGCEAGLGVEHWHPESSGSDFMAVVDRLIDVEPHGHNANIRVENCEVMWAFGEPEAAGVTHFYARVGVRLPHQKRHRWSWSGESLMEAGCRAALKAVRARKVAAS